jgi:iron(III) transport system substrate-binding protein
MEETPMRARKPSRRDLLKAGSGVLAATLFAEPLRAAAPPATAVTPELIAAARKEGTVTFYTAMELAASARMGKAFEAKYPGITARVERTGAERVFQRIGQEKQSGLSVVDVAESSDASHFLHWKRNEWLEPFVPEDVAKYFPPEHRDPDGQYATMRALLSSLGYNTNLVKAEDAPKSFNDLLDPKWVGKIVKAHPGYSGTVMAATFQIVRELGWGYLEKLAKQRVMQVQSATEPVKKLALGERAVQADGGDYLLVLAREKGQPVEPVYPTEGTPMVVCPAGVFKGSPHPNAAKLFANFIFSADGQQIISDIAQRTLHPNVKPKSGVVPLSKIKVWRDDPAGIEKASAEIKAHYTKLFHV